MDNVLSKAKSAFGKKLINIYGWKTDRKIICIESDDWGSIRIPSVKVIEEFKKKGIGNWTNSLNNFDNLEDENDLNALYDVLKKFKDYKNNPPTITANFVTANPDFEKIKKSGFSEYYYKLIPETYKEYNFNSFPVIKEGIKEKYIHPQFHGREHLNVELWMKELRKGSKEFVTAFELGVFGIDLKNYFSKRSNLMAALDFENDGQKKKLTEILTEGINNFEKLFGFKSDSFIAPCFVWSADNEKTLKTLGVNIFQGVATQFVPDATGTKLKKRFHYLGQTNRLSQVYLLRNCSFELSSNNKINWVSECLNQIEFAFKMKKPATISLHRYNLIGSLKEENRSNNLQKLDELLRNILKKWPETEFMTSDKIGNLILGKK